MKPRRKDEQELLRQIIARSRRVDGRRTLACASALRLAEECGVSPARIGRFCNEQGIRIARCQLGCF